MSLLVVIGVSAEGRREVDMKVIFKIKKERKKQMGITEFELSKRKRKSVLQWNVLYLHVMVGI